MKIKIRGKLLPLRDLNSLTLGECRELYDEFKWAPGSGDLDFRNPEHIGAITFLAFQQAHPEQPRAAVLATVNRLREIDFVDDEGNPITDDEDEGTDAAEDPTQAQAAIEPVSETAESGLGE